MPKFKRIERSRPECRCRPYREMTLVQVRTIAQEIGIDPKGIRKADLIELLEL